MKWHVLMTRKKAILPQHELELILTDYFQNPVVKVNTEHNIIIKCATDEQAHALASALHFLNGC